LKTTTYKSLGRSWFFWR